VGEEVVLMIRGDDCGGLERRSEAILITRGVGGVEMLDRICEALAERDEQIAVLRGELAVAAASRRRLEDALGAVQGERERDEGERTDPPGDG